MEGVSEIGGGEGWDGRFRAVVQCHTSLAFACRNSAGGLWLDRGFVELGGGESVLL